MVLWYGGWLRTRAGGVDSGAGVEVIIVVKPVGHPPDRCLRGAVALLPGESMVRPLVDPLSGSGCDATP
jgi:hypothetical protein